MKFDTKHSIENSSTSQQKQVSSGGGKLTRRLRKNIKSNTILLGRVKQIFTKNSNANSLAQFVTFYPWKKVVRSKLSNEHNKCGIC